MANFNQEAEQKEFISKVLVTKTELPANDERNKSGVDKTLVGFGRVDEYTNDKGELEKPNARAVMAKVANVNKFLSAVGENNMPLQISAKDGEKDVYMKANCFTDSGISKNGNAYRWYKMAFELQPEIKNEAGEITQQKQTIYATKGNGGYSFDENNDKALINKFNALVANGVSINLAASRNDTLKEHQGLMNALGQFEKSAVFEVGSMKQQGAYIKGFTELDNSGKEKGMQKVLDIATKSQDQSRDM